MQAWIENDAAYRIAQRRRKHPVREARRQAHLTKMLQRDVDYVPTYRDHYNRRGELVASTYLGHVAIVARRGVA